MKILHLLTSGGIGGIEVLCRDIALCSSSDNYFCFMFGEGIIYDQMKKQSKNIYSLHDGKKLSFSKFRKLKKIASSCDIVVVHHDDPFLETYYLALTYFCHGKKYISMVHHCYDPIADNLGYGVIKRKLKHYITAKMLKRSNELIFVSEAGKKSYVNNFCFDEKKTCVIYNGIGERFLDGGKSVIKKNHDVIRLLYVGRLVELKGVINLINILPDIIKKHDIHLDIVGDGKIRNDLETKVSQFGIHNKVTFHGLKNDVIPYLEEADIFVYPSKTEIFGISLVEAMAFKCICVGNNVGGIPEIISNEKNGFLNEDNSLMGLEKAIINAINVVMDDGRREEMMNLARMTAEKFAISNSIKALENVYQSLLEN